MLGDKNTPVHTKIMGSDASMGKLALVAVFTLAPVAIAILMQNPALRQSIQMKGWAAFRKFAHESARKWERLESIAATHYDIARL
jgi:hypothetical protein